MRRLLALFAILMLLMPVAAAVDVPAFTGSPTVDLGAPRFMLDLGGEDAVYLPLDDLGRAQGVSAILSATSSRRSVISDLRPTGFQQTTYAFIPGLNLYNRCHLLAHQLGGADAAENLFTGTQYINITAMRSIETAIADYLSGTGNHVRFEAFPVFEGDNLVCSGVIISAQSVEDDALAICVYCFNVQPGVSIDYASGLSTIAETSAVIAEEPSRAVPEETDAPRVTYVLNTNTHRFHSPLCQSVVEMKAKHRQDYYGDRESLIEAGYQPCGRCKP